MNGCARELPASTSGHFFMIMPRSFFWAGGGKLLHFTFTPYVTFTFTAGCFQFCYMWMKELQWCDCVGGWGLIYETAYPTITTAHSHQPTWTLKFHIHIHTHIPTLADISRHWGWLRAWAGKRTGENSIMIFLYCVAQRNRSAH